MPLYLVKTSKPFLAEAENLATMQEVAEFLKMVFKADSVEMEEVKPDDPRIVGMHVEATVTISLTDWISDGPDRVGLESSKEA